MFTKNAKKIFVAIMAISMIMVSFSSCDKLMSKEKMLKGEWKATYLKTENQGVEVVLIPNDAFEYLMTMTLKDDGVYSYTSSLTLSGTTTKDDGDGTWSLSEDDKTLTLDSDEYEIVALSSKEIHIKSKGGTAFEFKAEKQ